MTPPVTVRLAEPAEEPLVFAIMRAAFAESAAYPNPSSALAETEAEVGQKITNGGAVLAFDGGRPVGSGRFYVDRDSGHLAYERLAVLPALRGRGAGGAMVAYLEDHARSLSLPEVRADARSQQPDNRPFYVGRGYRILGYTKRYGIADMRTHMAKSL